VDGLAGRPLDLIDVRPARCFSHSFWGERFVGHDVAATTQRKAVQSRARHDEVMTQGGAQPCQGWGRGFESHPPLQISSKLQELDTHRSSENETARLRGSTKCAITGLNRIDIWRYFRHTWSLEYRPIPGRQWPLLIRNAARPRRPIIGIALLASPVMRLRIRDNWIGWTPSAWAKRLGQDGWDHKVAADALRARLDFGNPLRRPREPGGNRRADPTHAVPA
jgi:hypothetical protein